jgi:BlaI family transcriptional regulator, penicillinase repressor
MTSKASPHQNLSRRERQIMDVLFRLGRATAAEVESNLPQAPSYSAVRAHLRTLEDKGYVRHEEANLRYVYLPRMAVETARKGALAHLVSTFFGGSPGRAAAALLDEHAARLSGDELDRLAEMIDRVRKEGR